MYTYKLSKYTEKYKNSLNENKKMLYKKKILHYRNQSGGYKCPVCMETGRDLSQHPNEPRNAFVELYPCCHIICRHCIKTMRRDGQYNCPICRYPMLTEMEIPFDELAYANEDGMIEGKIEIAQRQIQYEDELKHESEQNVLLQRQTQINDDEQIARQIDGENVQPEETLVETRLSPYIEHMGGSDTYLHRIQLYLGSIPIHLSNQIQYYDIDEDRIRQDMTQELNSRDIPNGVTHISITSTFTNGGFRLQPNVIPNSVQIIWVDSDELISRLGLRDQVNNSFIIFTQPDIYSAYLIR
jgi:hypothetical protein